LPRLWELLRGIRLIGWSVAGQALLASLERAYLDRRYAPRAETAALESIGGVAAAELDGSTLRLRHERGRQALRFLADGLVERSWNDEPLRPSHAVVDGAWGAAAVELEETRDGWRATSGGLALEIARSGELRWHLGGRPVQTDLPLRAGARAWAQECVLEPGAVAHGLGQRAFGLDLRATAGSRALRLWNTEPGGHYDRGSDALYVSMPVLVQRSEAGCVLTFYDDPFDGEVTLGASATFRFSDGPKRCYLAFGSLPEVVAALARLTGRPPLPPRFALGFHQARWGYDSEAKVLEVLAGYREHELPLAALYLDYDHTDGWRAFTPDATRYPRLGEMVRTCRAAGVEVVASTNPGLKVDPEWDLFQEATREDVFAKRPDRDEPMTNVVWAGWTRHVDFTSERVRRWWGRQYPRLLRHGIRGFWHDMNEPSGFHAFGDRNPPLCMRHAFDDGRAHDHREAHNLYGLLMNRAGYEGLRELRPDERPFILSRSGWVGMQRYGWHWTGDVASSWSALRQTIPQVLGLGLCGMPYSGPDVGGFSGHPSPELYVRWFQLGAFLPFFRVHCSIENPPREPWRFGEEVLAICRRFLRLRYRLLPYWYTLACEAHRTGAPLVRPLGWAATSPSAFWQVDDAFTLGDSLLVAPALDEGERRRSLRLPSGAWYAFETHERFSGAATLELPLDRTGLLVRAGSILPTEEGGELVIRLYRPDEGEAGVGSLYTDEGDGYGPSRTDSWRLEPGAGGHHLRWTHEGEHPRAYRRARVRLFGFPDGSVYHRGEPLRDGQTIEAPR
jgi:alpha-glucosidase